MNERNVCVALPDDEEMFQKDLLRQIYAFMLREVKAMIPGKAEICLTSWWFCYRILICHFLKSK